MPDVKKTATAAKKVKATATEAPLKAPRKVSAKKATSPNTVAVNVIVEHHDRQIGTEAVAEAATKLWTLAGHDAAEITKIELYVKQEDGAIYCVVNGEAVGKYDL